MTKGKSIGAFAAAAFAVVSSYGAELVPKFRPKSGCIDSWIALAQDAGMKCVVLTTRHHEGFWLGDDFIR